MKRLGIILAIVAAVAAVPLVAMAWQGHYPAAGATSGGHMGSTEVGRGPIGWGGMEYWTGSTEVPRGSEAGPFSAPRTKGAPDVASTPTELLNRPAATNAPTWMGCSMWGNGYPTGPTTDAPFPQYPNDTVLPGYGLDGCPMWGNGYPTGPTTDAPFPQYPNDTVLPGYGLDGCPMWGDAYPGEVPDIQIPPASGYGSGCGGDMRDGGMMHRDW